MKKRATGLLVLAAVLVGTAGLTGSRLAFSEETETKQLKKDITAILLSQQTILAELKKIQDELNVVKVRCSS